MGACCHSQKATATVKPEPNDTTANLNMSASTIQIKEAFNVDITKDSGVGSLEPMKTPPCLTIDEIVNNSGLNCTALEHEPSEETIKLTTEIRKTRNK